MLYGLRKRSVSTFVFLTVEVKILQPPKSMEVGFSMKVLDNFPIVKPWNNSYHVESNAIDLQASEHPSESESDSSRLSEEWRVFEGMIFVHEKLNPQPQVETFAGICYCYSLDKSDAINMGLPMFLASYL